MGCSYQPAKERHGMPKLKGTFKTLIKSFKRVFDMILWDTFGEMSNIRMKEVESIAALSNRFLDLLLAECDPNNKITSSSAGFQLRCRDHTQY